MKITKTMKQTKLKHENTNIKEQHIHTCKTSKQNKHENTTDNITKKQRQHTQTKQ